MIWGSYSCVYEVLYLLGCDTGLAGKWLPANTSVLMGTSSCVDFSEITVQYPGFSHTYLSFVSYGGWRTHLEDRKRWKDNI